MNKLETRNNSHTYFLKIMKFILPNSFEFPNRITEYSIGIIIQVNFIILILSIFIVYNFVYEVQVRNNHNNALQITAVTAILDVDVSLCFFDHHKSRHYPEGISRETKRIDQYHNS